MVTSGNSVGVGVDVSSDVNRRSPLVIGSQDASSAYNSGLAAAPRVRPPVPAAAARVVVNVVVDRRQPRARFSSFDNPATRIAPPTGLDAPVETRELSVEILPFAVTPTRRAVTERVVVVVRVVERRIANAPSSRIGARCARGVIAARAGVRSCVARLRVSTTNDDVMIG
jgi:hypothetical protein